MPAQLPENHYDVVVLGSGLGGLMCAVMLAKEGLKVCVLEKNKQTGGCLQSFALHKKPFDSCVHYIGGLGEGHALNRLFQYAGIMDKLKLDALDPDGFDRIAFGQESSLYPQAIGRENFVEQLAKHFPAEKKNLERYVGLTEQVTDCFPLYHLRNGDPDEKASVAHFGLTKTLESLTPDTRLQNVLTGNNLLYAGVRGKTPFYIHALVLESYLHSAHKVAPASSQISKLLWLEIQRHGGTVFRNSEVKEIVEENGSVIYASNGRRERFYAKQFISNLAPKVLLGLLRSSIIRPAFRNRIAAQEQTISSFMLNLVLRPATVKHQPYNTYWHRSDDAFAGAHYQAGDWPVNYTLFFAEDAGNAGFSDTLSILCYMHYSEVAQWQQSERHSNNPEDRGPDYAAFKQEKSALLLEKVLERLPELRGNILAQSAATPLTYRDYTATPEGSLYGILKDVTQPAQTTIAIRTRIPNLLMTGQNVNLHGVLGVSITAVATCAELLGIDYLLGKINRN